MTKSKMKNKWSSLSAWDLDDDKYYDIKLPNGRKFTGCSVEIREEPRVGSGADECGTYRTAFFHHAGLTIELESDHLVRVNKNVTARRRDTEKRRSDRDELDTLLDQRKNLNEKIARLRKRKR